jgi:VWFA-related protein
MSKLGTCFVAFVLCFSANTKAQETTQKPEPPNPVLNERPPASPVPMQSVIEKAGSLKLDVVVKDAAGKPVAGLEPWDFSLFDNGKPQKILTFHGFNDTTVKPEPPVEVILLLDMANLPFSQVAFVRQEVDQFLHGNGGQLKQPTSLIVLTSAGIRVQPRASADGNALAEIVKQLSGNISTINPAMGGEGLMERFQLSVRQLETIAENEVRKPGRKLLIWVGPGWPMLNRSVLGSFSEKDQKRYFDGIVELSNRLRDARMVVDSVAPATGAVGSTDTNYAMLYENFLKPVRSWHDADAGNLALKVLVTQTGGLILGPDNDLAGQIDRCVGDANGFYRVSFNPPAAEHADEFHELKVTVDRPGMTVRTNTGYYSEQATQ